MSQTQPSINPRHLKKLADLFRIVSEKTQEVTAQPFLIAIDGRGGSGKSTLAKSLQKVLPDAVIVEMVDFIYPVSLRMQYAKQDFSFDWKRLKEQVLVPLCNKQVARYQRYDWPGDTLAEWHTIAPKGVVIVEGCYCAREELFDYYNLVIWVNLDKQTCLVRGLERESRRKNFLPQGEIKRIWLHEYQPLEDAYMLAHKTQEKAAIVFETI